MTPPTPCEPDRHIWRASRTQNPLFAPKYRCVKCGSVKYDTDLSGDVL